MKNKSEKFNTCTVCLSKMYKLLGVWAVAWLLLDQVCSVYIQVERLSQTPFTPGLRFPKYHKFYQEILFQLNFFYNRPSGELKIKQSKAGTEKVKTCYKSQGF